MTGAGRRTGTPPAVDAPGPLATTTSERLRFYRDTVGGWMADRAASVLVVAGGSTDRWVFESLGFQNVVISNLSAAPDQGIAPYTWRHEDLEALTCRDDEFDYVVAHAGLHHCRSPHRGLLEMYRVARRALVAFDPPDNFTVRLMQRLGLAQAYECVAVEDQDGHGGGMNDSLVPNFVYRWTEREVEKTICSNAPHAAHRFRYAYGIDAPTPQYCASSRIKRATVAVLKPAYRLYGRCFPQQRNLFGFMVEKPELPRDLQPWLSLEGGELCFVGEP